jgi:ABC-type branched-subunit amino acid transport system substrate-binding protein
MSKHRVSPVFGIFVAGLFALAACAPAAAPSPTAAPAKPAATTAPAAQPTAAPAAKPAEAKPAEAKPAAPAAQPAASPAAKAEAKPAEKAAAKPASGDPYRIGVTFPLTGPQAAWGTLLVPSIEIGVQDVNNAGGANGRPLSLVVEDSKGDPQAAVAAMRKVVQVDRVPVVQTIFTNVVTAQMALADQLKVPIISTIESPGLTDKSPYNFSN